MKTISKAKPFIKWVGGKGQLIEQLDAQLPEDFENWDDVTYIEPFVGGGAMLFYFAPPYRQLSDTSSFNDYAKEAFNDDARIRLKEYCADFTRYINFCVFFELNHNYLPKFL
jgi:site-specific DNA-adenine methylase